jgi:hypothetical protein
MYRGPLAKLPTATSPVRTNRFALGPGALNTPTTLFPENVFKVASGESVQAALDVRTNGGWVV